MDSAQWGIFTTPGLPWAHLACGAERRVEELFLWSGPSDFLWKEPFDTIVRVMRGKRCGTKDRLLQEWAAALQFPGYFGHNWDAFDECITDLWWLQSQRYIFIQTQVEHMLPDQDRELTIFLEVLHAAAQSWATLRSTEIDSPRIASFRVVFHCQPDHEQAVRQRLSQASAHLATMWGPELRVPAST